MWAFFFFYSKRNIDRNILSLIIYHPPHALLSPLSPPLLSPPLLLSLPVRKFICTCTCKLDQKKENLVLLYKILFGNSPSLFKTFLDQFLSVKGRHGKNLLLKCHDCDPLSREFILIKKIDVLLSSPAKKYLEINVDKSVVLVIFCPDFCMQIRVKS